MKFQLLLFAVFACAVSAGIPKKLLKKYAMRKVMESCYGEQLQSNLRAEVKAAWEKCGARQSPSLPAVRRRLQAMFARSESAPGPAQRVQNVHYVAVPVRLQPVFGQRRWKRNAYQGTFDPAKILKLRQKFSSMVGNASCVMRETKMLNADNEVDYDSIKARITSWPLPKELVDDMLQGMENCRQFSSCLPESIFDKRPLTGGFGKQIAFFKCMRMAKIEACVRHDLREEYLPELMKEDTDEEEGFQATITSALLGEGNVEEDDMM